MVRRDVLGQLRGRSRAVPTPQAILVVSAHWYINATAVTAMQRPRTIHDFFGFPQRLFDIEYPAPGMPELVKEVSDAVTPTWVGTDVDSWGIDHGTWSVLVHAFPDADIQGYDWAHRFDDGARERMLGDPASVAGLDAHRDFETAVPTPDHFLPLLYLAGLADAGRASGGSTDVLVDGYAYGSLSMTAYTLDLQCHVDGGGPARTPATPGCSGSRRGRSWGCRDRGRQLAFS